MSFDESLLEDEPRLQARDDARLLWSLATAGAQVRRAVETVADFGIERLRGSEMPRAMLVVTDSAPSSAARLITRLSCTRTPALTWHGVELPRKRTGEVPSKKGSVWVLSFDTTNDTPRLVAAHYLPTALPEP